MNITIHNNGTTLVCTDYTAHPGEPAVYHPDPHPGAPAEFDPVEGYVEFECGTKRELTHEELAKLSGRFEAKYLEMVEEI